jgi:hypothetical protein
MTSRLGDLYVDTDSEFAVGVNGVAVVDAAFSGGRVELVLKNLLAELAFSYEKPFSISIRLGGDRRLEYHALLINGELEIAVPKESDVLIEALPDGRFAAPKR